MSARPGIPPIVRYPSIADGYQHAAEQCPFIVTDASAWVGLHDAERILDVLAASSAPLFGYDAEGRVISTTTEAVLEAYRAGTLATNMLDAPLPALRDVLAPATRALLCEDSVSPVLTRAGTVTPFHVDPPLHGGGWMYLAQGEKRWTLVHPQAMDALYDRDGGCLRNPPLDELAALVGAETLRTGTLRAGEALFFPPGWIHGVATTKASVGLGGYWRHSAHDTAAKTYAAALAPGGAYAYWR